MGRALVVTTGGTVPMPFTACMTSTASTASTAFIAFMVFTVFAATPTYAGLPRHSAYAAAPLALPSDPAVSWALDIWERVEAPFAALTGRETAIAILAPDARFRRGGKKKAFPPSPIIFAGGPPTIYVPFSLLDTIKKTQAHPNDFLAFLLAHELGHRINDFDERGRPFTGTDHSHELADRRAAFFTVAAGFSTRRLAALDTISHFLELELGVPAQVRRARRTVLESVLTDFDTYEGIYQLGLASVFTGDAETGKRLLSWADELLQGKSGERIPVPEVRLLRALVETRDAAPHGPWVEKLNLPGANFILRCETVFPAHTAMAHRLSEDGLMAAGSKTRRTRAIRQLQSARQMVKEAAELGASALATATARACIEFYLGETRDAVLWQQQSQSLLLDSTPARVAQTVAANGALIALLDLMSKNPRPAQANGAPMKAWRGQIRTSRPRLHASPAVLRVLDRALGQKRSRGRFPHRSASPHANAKSPQPQPRVAHDGRGKAFRPPRPPWRAFDIPKQWGQTSCPESWVLLNSLPALAEAEGPSNPGATTCVPTRQTKRRWTTRVSRVHLAPAHHPPLEAVSTTLLLATRTPDRANSAPTNHPDPHSQDPRGTFADAYTAGTAGTLAEWEGPCHNTLTDNGVSHLGERIVLAVCPMTPGSTWRVALFVDDHDHILRLAASRVP